MQLTPDFGFERGRRYRHLPGPLGACHLHCHCSSDLPARPGNRIFYHRLLAQRRSLRGQNCEVSWTDRPATIAFSRGRLSHTCPLD